jgi:hypothetical protein
MRHLLLAATLTLGLLSLTPQDASACSCLPPPQKIDHRAWLKGFDGAVFEGTLVAEQRVVGNYGAERKMTFRVDRQWKGVTSPQIVVSTPVDSAACGIGVAPKVSRLIVASRTPEGFQTGICAYAYVLDQKAFRAAVGEGSPPHKR